MTGTNQSHDIFACLPLTLIQHKSITKVLDGRHALETRKSGIEHKKDTADDVFRIRSTGEKPLDAQFFEPAIVLGFTSGRGSGDDGDHFVGEFKRGTFKSDATGCCMLAGCDDHLQLPMSKQNPKSMWRIWPSESIMMFPL